MSLTEKTVITGVVCDKRDCQNLRALMSPVPAFSRSERDFIDDLLVEGWAIRVTRGRRFYCPDHAHLAGRCAHPNSCFGGNTCPVHGRGSFRTAATDLDALDAALTSAGESR